MIHVAFLTRLQQFQITCTKGLHGGLWTTSVPWFLAPNLLLWLFTSSILASLLLLYCPRILYLGIPPPESLSSVSSSFTFLMTLLRCTLFLEFLFDFSFYSSNSIPFTFIPWHSLISFIALDATWYYIFFLYC